MRVGPFRADIVARTSSETKVLIENQLAGADLQHLGQVLAYLAGLDAKIVIWVATGFHDSCLAAIRWLNEHTEQPYSFFAVRVRVAQIGDSKLAPVFEVLERPNEWVDDIRHREQHGGGLTQLGQFRRDFWEHFAENSDTRPRLKGPYAASSVHYKVEGTGLAIVQALSKHGNWIWIAGDGHEVYAEALAEALGRNPESLSWTGLWQSFDASDRSNWPKMVAWLNEHRRIYERVIRATPPPAGTIQEE